MTPFSSLMLRVGARLFTTTKLSSQAQRGTFATAAKSTCDSLASAREQFQEATTFANKFTILEEARSELPTARW